MKSRIFSTFSHKSDYLFVYSIHFFPGRRPNNCDIVLTFKKTMTTSLAQQLRSLALPQVASQFGSDRRRPSILFDEKEAANLDKATLHDIGVTGLTALIGVDQKFEKFHALLFSDASVDFDRLVMMSLEN